jgi:WXXGXW repeat (2 copies)
MTSRHIAVLLAVAACSAAGLARADTTAPAPQPTAQSPVMGPEPSADYVWMSGRWSQDNGQWKWIAAHWELPPSRSATWVDGHWAASNGAWVWVNGAWNVGQGQAQSAPPVPPTPGTAVPPAQTPAVAPAPAVTYYYTPGTTVVYPDYYVDPWAWVVPSTLFLGFGWGHAWGHGGWDHGGWAHGGGHWH